MTPELLDAVPLALALALVGCGAPEQKPSSPRPVASPPASSPAPVAGAPPADASPPASPGTTPPASLECAPWTAADDAFDAAARSFAADLEAKRDSLGASIVIDDSGPSCNATFAAPDEDAERAWRAFRGDVRAAFAHVPGLRFVSSAGANAGEPGATHLLTARLTESTDRRFELALELVDMNEARIVWTSRKSGTIGR